MRRRTIIAIAIAASLCFGVTAFWSAQTTLRDGETDSNVVSDSGAKTGQNMQEKKGGNKVVRALTSPFRALRRLFGGGKDEGKLERLSEKDVARFESTPASLVRDSRTPAESVPSASASAREHLAQGRAFLSAGRVNEAITELSLAASLDPRLSEAHSLLGLAYDRKGMPERARDSYERAIKGDPADAQTLNNLGFSLYQNGNYRAAVDKLKKAARLAPTDQRILNNLALAQMRLGKTDDAYKNFARAGGEVTGRLNAAAMLERLGRDEEAIKQYEAARRAEPTSTVALRRLAELYKRTGRGPEAQALNSEMAAVGGK
ncbi:MAG TPA: tetratricopeptide repeat protein [Pyrinomonadaceae bacterium]|jgi:tetratricopeptide (TPR) repeat protein